MSSFVKKHPFLCALGLVTVLIVGGLWALTDAIRGLLGGGGATDEVYSTKAASVAVVEVKGVMLDAGGVLRALTDCRKNADIKAVVLRVDSPGGVVGAAQEIFSEVRRTDREKPVIASMGSVAASGGYYAALGSRSIMASPGTVTGSIGVILRLPDLSSLYGKIGYRSQVVASGELKDTGNAGRPLTAKERRMLEGVVASIHGQFVREIAAKRGLAEERVRALADGRIFSGEQAVHEKLVDRIGNFTDAVALAAQLGGIRDAFPRVVYPEEKSFSLLRFFSASADFFQAAEQFFLPRTGFLM